MFDTDASSQAAEAFRGIDDAGVAGAITAAAREQNAACARELAAIGELYARRAPEADIDRANWAVDGHANVVAEVSAALGISRGRARGLLRYAIDLRERLPRVAEVFARGDIDFRLMATLVSRTELVEDPVLIAKLDAAVAKHAHRWMRLSKPKLIERIDMWVARFDPAGRRMPGQGNDDRYVEIGPVESGLAGIWAQLRAPDGAALDQKLDALAATVCRDDPRTKRQRRADAFGALAAGLDALRCECGSPTARPPAGRRAPMWSSMCSPSRPPSPVTRKLPPTCPATAPSRRPRYARWPRPPNSSRCRSLLPIQSPVIAPRRRWPNSCAYAISRAGSRAAMNRPRCARSTTPCPIRWAPPIRQKS